MRFETPLAFLFLVFLPLVLEPGQRRAFLLYFGLDALLLKRSLRFSSPLPITELEKEARNASFRVRRGELILSLFRAASFIALIIALARPQLGTSYREVESSGRDIILTLDLSGSMRALDFFIDKKRVDRLTALKAVVNDFIEKRKGDRMGLIVFAEQVFTQCPLTSDHAALKQFLFSLEIGMAGESTAIGDAIAVSLKRISTIKSDSKVIILVTDGASNAGNLQPLEAAQMAKKLGVKIYTIGIGGNELAPFPMKDMFGITRLVEQKLDFDEKTLQEIARVTDGRYFNAKDTSQLQEIYGEIDKLEERVEKRHEYMEYEERYLPWTIAALLLFTVAEILAHSWLLRTP